MTDYSPETNPALVKEEDVNKRIPYGVYPCGYSSE